MNWSAVWEWVRSVQLGPLVAWIAVVPAAISATMATRQARKSAAAAHDAREALAVALRPVFAFGDGGWHSHAPVGPPRLIAVTNTSSVGAVDVAVTITAKGGKVIGTGVAERVVGKVPGTLLGGPDLAVEVTFPDQAHSLGQRMVLGVSARFSDVQGIQRWHQQGQLTWEVGEASNGDMYWHVIELQHGEPERYRQAP